MPLLDDRRQRAAYAIVLLGVLIAVALYPFVTGLIGIPVLWVIYNPVYQWLRRRLREPAAAAIVVALGLAFVVMPLMIVAGILAREAQDVARGVFQSPMLARVAEVRIGDIAVGARLADVGRRLVDLIGASAIDLLGAATRFGLNVVIASFGLYYLLQRAGSVWDGLLPYIPFSPANADVLRARFEGVTISTLIGTGLTAAIQGALVGLAFTVVGLKHALFWTVVTAVLSVLPVVGSGLVWGPAGLALLIEGRAGWGILMILWGAIVVGNVDSVIRPVVYRRWAHVHPLITIVGAFGGIRYFGLLGLLIGPLALSYFFELLRMYRAEYIEGKGTGEHPAVAAGLSTPAPDA